MFSISAKLLLNNGVTNQAKIFTKNIKIIFFIAQDENDKYWNQRDWEINKLASRPGMPSAYLHKKRAQDAGKDSKDTRRERKDRVQRTRRAIAKDYASRNKARGKLKYFPHCPGRQDESTSCSWWRSKFSACQRALAKYLHNWFVLWTRPLVLPGCQHKQLLF